MEEAEPTQGQEVEVEKLILQVSSTTTMINRIAKKKMMMIQNSIRVRKRSSKIQISLLCLPLPNQKKRVETQMGRENLQVGASTLGESWRVTVGDIKKRKKILMKVSGLVLQLAVGEASWESGRTEKTLFYQDGDHYFHLNPRN